MDRRTLAIIASAMWIFGCGNETEATGKTTTGTGTATGGTAGPIEIIGNWVAVPPYGAGIASAHTARITETTFDIDWTDSDADVLADIVTVDNANNVVTTRITADPDSPYNVGGYLKITWSSAGATDLELSWFGVGQTESDVLAATSPDLGVIAYMPE